MDSYLASDNLLDNEPSIRLAIFLGIFLLMAIWELLAPRRVQNIPRRIRWPNNLGIVLVNTLLLRFALPAGAVGVAQFAQILDWGLFNQFSMPYWLAFLLGIIVLDLAIYLQHVMFHAVPGLWRLHRMHHADLEYDVTTGARFHPVEILLSMVIKLTIIVALGLPAMTVLIFEIILNTLAMFNHANARLPLALDVILRKIIVTPDMHRVHHSVLAHEANSNFGFNLSLWDRCLGTYRAQPEGGHEQMNIGIDQFRNTRDLGLDRMLIQPFKNTSSNYSINRQSIKRRG